MLVVVILIVLFVWVCGVLFVMLSNSMLFVLNDMNVVMLVISVFIGWISVVVDVDVVILLLICIVRLIVLMLVSVVVGMIVGLSG